MSFWQSDPPLVVGHRGGRGDGWPLENSVAAFERARREGAGAVELDTRACDGGHLVVFHDETLSRATDGQDGRRVRDVRIDELRAKGIPLLEEALSWARSNRVAVNVEIKHHAADRIAVARGTVRAIRATGADVLLSSFDPILLTMAACLAPTLPRAMLVHSGQPMWADILQRAARPPLVHFLHLERAQVQAGGSVARTIGVYLRRGSRVGVWTINEPQEAIDLVRRGVASIITDAPGAIVEALALIRT
ncbi:MAG: glycerophosphodiester phosphodiesterase [Myxococcota bacterium]|nr:glycerophosphodiester phosphodiesterase [Myxococcota bacterium]